MLLVLLDVSYGKFFLLLYIIKYKNWSYYSLSAVFCLD